MRCKEPAETNAFCAMFLLKYITIPISLPDLTYITKHNLLNRNLLIHFTPLQHKPKHATPEEILPLLQLFNYLSPLSLATENFLTQNAYPVTLMKGESLHDAGTVCSSIYFIKKGVVRGFINDEGKDKTTWISVENEVVASIYSFIRQVSSIENMQAIEDCELLRMGQADVERLYQLSPEFNMAARRVYERYYADAEVRALIVRLSSAQKKYSFFLQTYAHLSNRIPLTYIASFLGISLETLSRVRARLKAAGKAI